MRKLKPFVVMLIALWALPAVADMEPTLPSLSNDQVERLNAGEILIELVPGEAPIGDTIGIIDAPSTVVVEVIMDFDSYSDFMDDMESSEVVSIDESGEYHLRGVTSTPWPMENRYWETMARGSAVQLDGVDVIVCTWEYIPDSGNIEGTTGYWLMLPWGPDGTQTLLRYRLQVDLGTWLPDFVLEWSTENFLPTKVQDLRDRIVELGLGN